MGEIRDLERSVNESSMQRRRRSNENAIGNADGPPTLD
jgi:hypothetical protein